MKGKILLSMFLFIVFYSLLTILPASAAPNAETFGGKSNVWVKAPLGPGWMYTNTHNGLIIHWVPGVNSPHHIGLTTTKPGMNSNGAVADTALPGASDVLPATPSGPWGPPNK